MMSCVVCGATAGPFYKVGRESFVMCEKHGKARFAKRLERLKSRHNDWCEKMHAERRTAISERDKYRRERDAILAGLRETARHEARAEIREQIARMTIRERMAFVLRAWRK